MYSLQILRQAVKDIADLPKGYTRLVGDHIERLAQDPRPGGARKLQGAEGYRLRVGIYRILYEIDDSTQTVTIYRVKHRRGAYR